MTLRRSSLAMVALLPALLLVARGSGEAGERRSVERTEGLLVLTVKGPIQEVLTALQTAIARRNYFVAGINHLDDTLRRRAADLGKPFDFDHYKILSFCNLTLADEGLRADPNLGAFMPCRLAVFVRKGRAEVTIVAMRPTFVSRALQTPEVQRLAAQVEADVVAILEMVAADLP